MSRDAIRTLLAAALALWTIPVAAQAPRDLAEVLQRGEIRIALYDALPPFSGPRGGIDLDVAQALADKLGVRLVPVLFSAGEDMEDDLRNMVWKGHYLGVGPADAMLHAPVDSRYSETHPRVRFVAPYYREAYAVGYDTRRIVRPDTLAALATETVGVEGMTWPDVVLLVAEGGRYRDHVVHFGTSAQALAALQSGRVAAVIATRSELGEALQTSTRFAIAPVPLPDVEARQWSVGIAVMAEHDALSRRLQRSMDELEAEGAIARIFAAHGVARVAP